MCAKCVAKQHVTTRSAQKHILGEAPGGSLHSSQVHKLNAPLVVEYFHCGFELKE